MSAGVAFGLAFVALGLLALFRAALVNRLHVAMIKAAPWPPRKMPGLTATRLVGAWFVLVGGVIAVFNFVNLLRI